MLIHQFKEQLQIKARHGYDACALGQEQVHQNRHAIDVKERQEGNCGVMRFDPRDHRRLIHIRHQIAMGQHHAFGPPRGAR